MRKLMCLFGIVLLMCLTAAAQEQPNKEVFLGYSYIRANPASTGAPSFNVNGGVASFAYMRGSAGFVSEISGYRVGQINGTNVDTNAVTYLFGPRLAYRRNYHYTPFVQALFGGVHSTGSALGISDHSNAFAMAVGGGLDVSPWGHLGIRVGQVDYLLTRFREGAGDQKIQNNLRFSSGIVFRF